MQDPPEKAAARAMEPFAQFAEQGAQALSATNGAMMRICAGCNKETLDFMDRRARAYSNMPGDLAGCSSAQDVFQLQSRFVETMMRDYQNHAQKIAGLMTDFAKIDLAPASEGKTEAVAMDPSVKRAAEPAKRAA